MNVRIVIELNDMLIFGRSIKEAMQARDTLIFLLQKLGFVLNLDKSQFQQVKTLEFLGLNIDTQATKISLTEEKVKRVKPLCKKAKRAKIVSILSLTKLIGTLSSTVQAVMPAHLQFRYLQQDQIRALKKQGSYRSKLKLGRLSKLELDRWIENLVLCNGRNIHSQEPTLVIRTDASKVGWGAYNSTTSTGGTWSKEESLLHMFRS